MPDTWFTADFHFGHSNIIRYCNRPFGDVAEMDQAILDRVNSSVKASDLLYFLGDFCIGGKTRALAYRNEIRCKRIFALPGNHDKETRKLTDVFSWLKPCRNIDPRPAHRALPLCYARLESLQPRSLAPVWASLTYLLHCLWTSEWTPMISVRGTSTK